MPTWLLKDGFLWQELFKLFLSLIGSLFLAWLIQLLLTNRDRRIQEIERKRNLLNDIRLELVQIFQEYYRVRKRYTTIRDTFSGVEVRNPYILSYAERRDTILDDLLVMCIGLEARYATLRDRIKVSFPDVWTLELQTIMERKAIHDGTLEAYFNSIRYHIENAKDIDKTIKEPLSATLQNVLTILDKYDRQIGKTKVPHS